MSSLPSGIAVRLRRWHILHVVAIVAKTGGKLLHVENERLENFKVAGDKKIPPPGGQPSGGGEFRVARV